MADVSAGIGQIFEAINRSSVAFSNRYEVLFGVPQIFNTGNYDQLRNMTVRCDSVTVPGRSFSTVPYRFYGPARNMPYEAIYAGEMTLSVLLSADMRERKFFEDWFNLVCRRDDYKFQYYNDYVCDMRIDIMTRSDKPTHRFIVEEVYPKSIGDLQLSYDKDNDFLRQEVVLNFRKYSSEYIGYTNNSGTKPSDIFQLFPKIQ